MHLFKASCRKPKQIAMRALSFSIVGLIVHNLYEFISYINQKKDIFRVKQKQEVLKIQRKIYSYLVKLTMRKKTISSICYCFLCCFRNDFAFSH